MKRPVLLEQEAKDLGSSEFNSTRLDVPTGLEGYLGRGFRVSMGHMIT